jgi:S-DNA-T family DNA segregation ATPase FtsK/SpoIIIE
MLDQNGAESLVGNGDMLVQCQAISRNNLIRAQGCFISSIEIKSILGNLKENYKPEYDPNFTNLTIIDEFAPNKQVETTSYLDQNKSDPLYPQIREYVYGLKFCSISNIQRVFSVGFNRAGKILNQLVKDGIVSAEEGVASRGKEVIIHSEAEYNDKVLDNE